MRSTVDISSRLLSSISSWQPARGPDRAATSYAQADDRDAAPRFAHDREVCWRRTKLVIDTALPSLRDAAPGASAAAGRPYDWLNSSCGRDRDPVHWTFSRVALSRDEQVLASWPHWRVVKNGLLTFYSHRCIATPLRGLTRAAGQRVAGSAAQLQHWLAARRAHCPCRRPVGSCKQHRSAGDPPFAEVRVCPVAPRTAPDRRSRHASRHAAPPPASPHRRRLTLASPRRRIRTLSSTWHLSRRRSARHCSWRRSCCRRDAVKRTLSKIGLPPASCRSVTTSAVGGASAACSPSGNLA